MKNEYKIIDDYMIIYIKQRNENKFETLVDLDDINKIKNKSWHVAWKKNINDFYAQYCKYLGIINGKPKYKTIFMHDIIMNPKKNQVVDHIDTNLSLDNRKRNLRITSTSKNSMNRRGKNKNNTSGYRNVCKIGNKWVVQLQINDKNKRLGSFNNVDDAGKFAEEMRLKHYGKFAGGD